MRLILLFACLLTFTALGLPASGQDAPQLQAGFAAVKITPSLDRPVYIAGYDNNRRAESVHDDLWARAMVLDDGSTRMAVVVCDLIGLSNLRVRKIRQQIQSVPRRNVMIATTHVHSGPDTLGMWGPNLTTTGLDPNYLEFLQERIVSAVDTAAASLRPASLRVGSVEVPDGLVHNRREPIQDKELTALKFVGADGKTIGSVIHYGGHPEVNKGRALTSDYVHYVREKVEQKHGGVALYLNGALGGMVTPKVSANTFEEMQRVGEGVGDAALQALDAAKPLPVQRLSVRRTQVEVPMENSGFLLMLALNVLDGQVRDGKATTEVWRVDLGDMTWVSIPGEILPKPALDLKAKMPGKYPLVVSMANDELGYILAPEDYDRKKYSYEKSKSIGKQTWPLLLQAAEGLLQGTAPADARNDNE